MLFLSLADEPRDVYFPETPVGLNCSPITSNLTARTPKEKSDGEAFLKEIGMCQLTSLKSPFLLPGREMPMDAVYAG